MATVEDKKTGVHFPTSFTPPGSDKSMTVLGCGLREKHVMGVNLHVYSISCHVDPEAAKKALAAFQGKDILAEEEDFFATVRDGAFDMALTICLCKTLTEYLFVTGIKESVEPRLKARGGSEELLDSFIKGLSGLHYSAGSRVFLTFLHPAKLLIASASASHLPASLLPPEGMQTVVVESPLLCSVVKDAYFAHYCVSPEFRESVVEGAKLLLG